MHVRGTLTALALAALALPTAASSAIVQRWNSVTANFSVVYEFVDLNVDNHAEMLTVEHDGRIGVRSCSTGALLAETAAPYDPRQFWLVNLEATNEIPEVIFSDHTTGNLVCVNYLGGSTLPVRWSFMPTPNGVPSTWTFVDFDGTGQAYMVFTGEVGFRKYYVWNNNGSAVTTIDHSTIYPGTGWSTSLIVGYFDTSNRQGLTIDYHYGNPGEDLLYAYGSDAPAPQALVTRAGESRTARPVRRIEQVNGVWTEAAPAKVEASATLRAVRLP